MSDLPYDTDPVYKDPGTKVLHVPDADIHTVCHTLVSCLGIIKGWLDAHPGSIPIPIMMEFKVAEELSEAHGGAKIIPWDNEELLSGLDEEIRSVFPNEMLITPDDVRRDGLTLEESILKAGWPDLDSARGRIFFLMDNGPDHPVRHKYREDRPSLEGRVLFTNSAPGNPDCAFQKVHIQAISWTIVWTLTCPVERTEKRRNPIYPRPGAGRLLGPYARRSSRGHCP